MSEWDIFEQRIKQAKEQFDRENATRKTEFQQSREAAENDAVAKQRQGQKTYQQTIIDHQSDFNAEQSEHLQTQGQLQEDGQALTQDNAQAELAPFQSRQKKLAQDKKLATEQKPAFNQHHAESVRRLRKER